MINKTASITKLLYIFTLLLLLSACGDSGSSGDSSTESQPVAKLTAEIPASVGETAYLDATSSYDPDGKGITDYKVIQINGLQVELVEVATGRYSFVMPDTNTSLQFLLVVTSQDGDTNAFILGVAPIGSTQPPTEGGPFTGIENFAPVAHLAHQAPVQAGQLFILDGRKSYDPEGAEIAYSFMQISGPKVDITQTEPGLASFIVPPTSSDLNAVFRLIVSDDKGLTGSTEITVALPAVINTSTLRFNVEDTMTVSALSQMIPINWKGPGLSLTANSNNHHIIASVIGDIESGNASLMLQVDLESLSSVVPSQYYPSYIYDTVNVELTYGATTNVIGIATNISVFDRVSSIIPQVNFNIVSGVSDMPSPAKVLFNGFVLTGVYSNDIVYGSTTSTQWASVWGTSTSGYSVGMVSSDLQPGQHTASVYLTNSNGVTVPITVNVNVAAPDMVVKPQLDIVINQASGQGEFTIADDVGINSPSLVWDVVSEASWITVSKNKAGDGVDILLDEQHIKQLANGSYSGTILYTYSSPYTPELLKRTSININMQMAEVTHVTPRVTYSSEISHMRIRGNNLNLQIGDVIQVAGVDITSYDQPQPDLIKFDLPAGIVSGEYQVVISNALGVNTAGPAIVVKQHPVFPTQRITIPQRAGSFEYDAEREKIYIMSGQIAELSVVGGAWQWANMAAGTPVAMSMTQDGNELLVTQPNCIVLHVDLVNKLISQPYSSNASCYYVTLGFIEQLYDGETLVADTNQWPTIWTYPGWATHSYLSEHSPIGLASRNNTHFIWAGSPTISGQRHAYIYSADTDTFQMLGTVAGDYYLKSLFSISANGERISHYTDIYDQQLQYLGRVGAPTINSLDRLGISPDGKVAAQFEYATKQVKFYDISTAAAPFIQIGNTISLSATDVSIVDRIEFSDDSKYVFIFTYNVSTSISYMYIEQVGI